MKNNIKLGLCSAAAALAMATTANAFSNQDAIRYSIDGGSTWVDSTTVPGLLDTDGDGAIAVQIVAGGFQLRLASTGVNSSAYPTLGSPASPNMDLDVVGRAVGTGSIIIEFSTTGFAPIPSGSYITTFQPNDDSSVVESEATRVGTGATGNNMFAAGASAGTIGGASTGTYHSTIGAPVPGQPVPYSITLAVTFTATGATTDRPGSISSDTHLVVPDGGNTLMLLGSALSVLGLGVFRKSRKA
jgi:hypothetical protein